MFRARKILQPMIPHFTREFCEDLSSMFELKFKATVIVDGRIAVIVFFEELYDLLADITDIKFNGRFFNEPKQSIVGSFLHIADMPFQPLHASRIRTFANI